MTIRSLQAPVSNTDDFKLIKAHWNKAAASKHCLKVKKIIIVYNFQNFACTISHDHLLQISHFSRQ